MKLHSLECPKCGAPFDIPDASRPTMECPYCGNTVAIPPELRSAAEPEPSLPAWQPAAMPVLPDLARLAEVKRLAAAGQKIEAIKLLRDLTGLGLKEAKDTVEAIQRGEPVTLTSQSFSAGPAAASAPPFQVERPAAQVVLNTDQVVRQLPKAAAAFSIGGILVTVFILALTICLPLGILLFAGDNPVAEMFQAINPAGFARPTVSFGGEGSGQGFFDDPRAITVDGQGFVYVADFDSGRIQRFDAEGNFQNLWRIPPPETSNSVIISALAADNAGRVYALGRGELIIFDGATGQELERLEILDPESGSSVYLDDIVLTSDEKLALVYDGEEILLTDRQGAPQLHIPRAISSITRDSELNGMLTVDGAGNLFLVGSFNDTVVRYSPDGVFNTRFGGEGDQPGQFTAILDIASDAYGRIYVSDIYGVSVFDGDGRFLRRFDVPGVAYGLAFDRAGGLWITSSETRVIRFDIQPPSD